MTKQIFNSHTNILVRNKDGSPRLTHDGRNVLRTLRCSSPTEATKPFAISCPDGVERVFAVKLKGSYRAVQKADESSVILTDVKVSEANVVNYDMIGKERKATPETGGRAVAAFMKLGVDDQVSRIAKSRGLSEEQAEELRKLLADD